MKKITYWVSRDPGSEWVDIWLVHPVFTQGHWHLPPGSPAEVDTGAGPKPAHFARCSAAIAQSNYGTIPDDHRMLIRNGDDPIC